MQRSLAHPDLNRFNFCWGLGAGVSKWPGFCARGCYGGSVWDIPVIWNFLASITHNPPRRSFDIPSGITALPTTPRVANDLYVVDR